MMHPDLYGVRTLIFDMDGTLIASEKTALTSLRAGLAAFYETLGKTAPEYTDEQLIAGIGAPSDEFYETLLRPEDRGHMEAFRDFIHSGEDTFLKENDITFEGTHETLAELRKRGYKTAVVSNCHTPYLHSVMTTQKLGNYFDILSCVGDFEGATKESLVKIAVDQLGGPAVVIGDRYYDIDAAIANDLPSVGALYGYGDREELSKSSTWVSEIGNLLDLFHPLREAAARIAAKVNEVRSIERPVTLFIGSEDAEQLRVLSGWLLTELASLNAPATQIQLPATADDGYHEWLKSEVVNRVSEGKIDTMIPGEEKPLRARAGFVVLVTGKPAQFRDTGLDLVVEIAGNDDQKLVESADFVVDSSRFEQGEFLKLP